MLFRSQHEEIRAIITALGAGIGTSFKPEKLRYHRVVIMTDADVDGAHIRTLLLTFFFRNLEQLIHDGYLYIALPPLYRVQEGKEKHWVYTDEQRDAMLTRIRAKGVTKEPEVQRYKGLGEMNAEQLWDTTLNPATRTLKRVTLEDAELADLVFDELMGSEVEGRKKWIMANADKAALDI